MLHVHRAERADVLVAPLAAVLAVPLADPFAPDIVATPTRGVERWLAQRLSHVLGADADGAGVCANVSFDSPARIVGGVLARVLALDPDDDPWSVPHLTWTVLDELDRGLGLPEFGTLARYLGHRSDSAHDVRLGRRLTVARRLATLFATYSSLRPSLIRDWANVPGGGGGTGDGGTDDGATADGLPYDGAGEPVPADLRWQVDLWRRVRARVGVPSPAERLREAVTAIDRDPEVAGLPARLSVFGPTRIADQDLAVLAALGSAREVHLWLPHPSPALWSAVAAIDAPVRRRRALPDLARHPLLASMARDAIELQLRLAATTAGRPVADHHHPSPTPPRTLLGEVQRQLRADEPPGAAGTVPPDDTVQVHACFGRARQVEVLREVLVGLMADDPTLEPRDVVVMCPDIEAMAPLVAATFGAAPDADAGAAAHPGQTLRVRLADRGLRRTNPHLALLATLLDLADGRVTATEVLDLAAGEPVRRRFGFTDDDLEQLRSWAADTGVRWGEDAARRVRFGLADLRQGTWDAAVDRLTLGVAMADEASRYLGSALPVDDVDSTDIDLVGRLAEFVDRLTLVLGRLSGAAPLDTWLRTLTDALDLLTDAAPDTAWQGMQARAVLADLTVPERGTDSGLLRLPDVRALLADLLAPRPTRSSFRTGALTVCSLEPMRSVPHRVVCLLGLDDDAFPRSGGADDGDNVLLRDPCLGERDRRSEDRQIFLDAVTAAAERLIVLYSGADERTGASRPPAVPVSELLDTVAAVAEPAARDVVVVRHPLSPVDERNFVPAPPAGRPRSFDAVAYRAALARRGPGQASGPLFTTALPDLASDADQDLDVLIRMIEQPATQFLRRRLGITLVDSDAEVHEALPLDLDPLEEWAVGDHLLAACLAGVDRDQAANAEWRRGAVPPRLLGRAVLRDVLNRMTPVAQELRSLLNQPASAVDVAIELPGGKRVSGTVGDLHGECLVRGVYSRLGPKHRLRSWVQLLALAADPAVATGRGPLSAVTVGRAGDTVASATVSGLRAPSQAVALTMLAELADLADRGLRAPLPVPVGAAHAYARARRSGRSAERALEIAGATWPARRADAYDRLCWSDGADLATIGGVPAGDEAGWWPEEPTRFGVLSRRIWQPLLDHETLRDTGDPS